MGQTVPLLVHQGRACTPPPFSTHLLYASDSECLTHLPERDPLRTPTLPEDDAEAKQLAGRHHGLEGHGLVPAGEH